MIELNGVTEQYGALTAVDHVSFRVEPNESFALLGPNGAGKTTIVKMLLDFTRPSSGRLTINGVDCTKAESRAGKIGHQHALQHKAAGLS